MKYILIQFVRLYRVAVSPFFSQTCRFYPTCSSYMMQVLESHGVIKGGWLGFKRLLKCHPYYKGDYVDPPPEKSCNK